MNIAGRAFLLFLLLFISCISLQAQTAISTINTSTVAGTGTSNVAVAPSDAANSIDDDAGETFTINYGQGNNFKVVSYVVSGTTYDRFLAPDTLVLNRAEATDRLVNIWFTLNSALVDNTPPTNDVANLDADEVEDADAIYLSGNLNAGYDNILVNIDDLASGSIEVETERVDVIWSQGIQTSSPSTAVFPIIERGGNDNIAVAAITSLNVDGTPASYGNLVGIPENGWPGAGTSFDDYLILRRETAGSTPLPLLDIGAQIIQGVAISFSTFGISANTPVYGYSIFSADVVSGYVSNTSSAVTSGIVSIKAGIDLADISTFPTDSRSSDSGLDLVAGVSAAVASDDNLIEVKGPGGYKAALSTWLKANAGAFVTGGGAASTEGNNVGFWEDQSVGNHDFLTSTAAPTFRSTTSSINFNPTVDFVENVERGLTLGNNSDYNDKVVNDGFQRKGINIAFRTNANDISTKQQLYEQGGETTGLGIYIRNGNIYAAAWNRGNAGEPTAPWNETTETPFISTGPIELDTEYILTFELNGDNSGLTGSMTAYLNGQSFGTISNVGLLFDHTGGIEFGDSDGSRYDDGTTSAVSFDGEISEFIYCNEPAVILSGQRNRIESYLAIKYGITLNQSTPINYYNADGDIIFNTTLSASLGGFLQYNKDIAGIGRDDASELEQAVSRSENVGSVVTMARNTEIGTDETFLIWGNDEGALTTVRTEVPDVISERLERVWRVAEENEMGQTDISFDLSGLGLGTDPNDFALLIGGVSSLGDFSSGTVVGGGTFSGDVITFPNVNLSDGQYFTLATQYFICTPGNVPDGLALWLKADVGTNSTVNGASITTWDDQGRNGYQAANDVNRSPTYVTNSVNFNPGLNFPNDAGSNAIGFNLGSNYIFADDTDGGLHVFSAIEPIDAGTDNNTRQQKMIYSFGNRTPANVGFGSSDQRGTIQSPGTNSNFNITAGAPSFLVEADYVISAGASDTRNFIIDGEIINSATLSFQLDDANIDQDPTHQANAGPVSIGRQSENTQLDNNSGRRYYGDMNEIIVYNSAISALDAQKIRSYLALKYGTSLTNDNNANTIINEVISGSIVEGDYVASNGTTITWDYSDDTGFVSNVAGIGRDDDTCLDQKQSRSVNSDAILTVGLGDIAATNGANSNTFDNDLDFFTWATDGASTAFANISTAGTPGTVTERMLRIWRAQKTGTVGATEISFDLTGLAGYSANAGDYQLIIANGGDNTSLENGTTLIGGVFNGSVLSFAGVDLTDGQFFTLGTQRTACFPGGVDTDLYVWLRADAGTSTTTNNNTLTTWTDQAGNVNAVTDGNPPLFLNNTTDNINFNPTIDFDGVDDRLSLGNLANIKSGAANGGDYTLIAIGFRQSGGTTQYVLGSGGGTSNEDLHFGYRNNTAATIAHWANDLDVAVNSFDSPESPFLLSSVYNGTTRNIEETRGGNYARASQAETVDLQGSKTNYIGDVEALANYSGLISEIIIFDNDITELQKQQVNTYLAIKYGITLTNNNDNDGITNEILSGSVREGDYVASNGTTIIWTYANNTTYHNDVAGIGRDDDGCFSQKQSTAVDTDDILTIGLGSVATSNGLNVNSFGDNRDYLVWGNDNGATAQASANTVDVPVTIAERISRVWKVQDTGNVGATELEFDLTGLGYSTNASDFSLIISNSSTMASGTLTTGGTFAGNVLSFAGIDLLDGQFFTLATQNTTCGPGGVNSNIALWLRADEEVFSDAGTTAAVDGNNALQWNDQSSPADNGSEIDLGGGSPIEPTFQTSEINSNPVLRFTDPNSTNASYIETSSNSVSGNMTLISVFRTGQTAGTANDFVNSPALIGASVASTADYGLGMDNGTIWMKASDDGDAFDVETAATFNNNRAHFTTATRTAAGAITIYVDGNSEATGTGNGAALTGPSSFGIGNHSDADLDAQYSGDIAETIVFSAVLNSDERNRVESYLALKYGMTMNASDDVGTGAVDERDYRAADGGVIWDYTGQTITYYNDIFGIGRDDLSCFELRQTKSENLDAIVSFNLPAGFGTNDSFILSGNDGAVIEQVGNKERPAEINSRLNREWRVQETGTVGSIQVTFDLDQVTGPLGVGTNNLSLLRLMVDNDGDFSADAILVSPTSFNGANNTVTFTVNFTDGQYYTLGSLEIDALPITLLSFEAKKSNENQVKLDWATADETNNSFFTIERSANGADFEAIANLQGAGNSESTNLYNWVDTKPIVGNNYYRLRQTDFNGESSVSEIVRVFIEFFIATGEFSVYPNPVQIGENLNIKYSVSEQIQLEIKFVSTYGQVLFNQNQTVDPESGVLSIPTNQLQRGLTLVIITNLATNQEKTFKVIVR
ncbi:MAG: hypothetical protein ACJAXB_000066 [Candidatus Endobugula sp.]|jgi:hypothetical protein